MIGIRRVPARSFHPTVGSGAIPPLEILRVMRELDRDGLELVAIFNPHPATRACPSPTDIQNAHHPDSVYLILSLAGDEPDLRGYRIVDGQVHPVDVRVA
ncbi:Mov34/MPN/PAD-1 family protein [Caldinitratiruptor microaerophilus]|uniref:Mov34/MPN/PAD-1 family protein n=1 Tax=Caldinitratiruptor microaerophilus TaxID=671077 RepID=UPI00223033DE|nr:Mov34/MPN/PAD-1 family protein [Caldinitratiruptor microaerophilus]